MPTQDNQVSSRLKGTLGVGHDKPSRDKPLQRQTGEESKWHILDTRQGKLYGMIRYVY